MGDTRTVIKWGVFSRICIVLLQVPCHDTLFPNTEVWVRLVSFPDHQRSGNETGDLPYTSSMRSGFSVQVISHNLIPDHKGSLEDVFMRHHRHPPHDLITETLFGGFDNWDSEYFIFIAQHGYSRYEQTMAFFPLYPFLMGLFAKTALFPLSLWMFPRSILLISGVVLNLLIFPLAAAVLYLLTMEISKNKKLSLLAAALFCVNPASVFMSAAYTGCLFAALTFAGMLALEKRQPWASTFLFALAGATRSNGMVLCGFIAYYHLVTILHNIKQTSSFVKSMVNILKILVTAAAQCCIIMLPFVLFQCYGYLLYCTSGDTQPPWCTWTVPISYSYIQEKYWNVGFLSYYEMKQLPNFLLAAPMILLSIYCVWSYLRGRETATGTEQMKDMTL